MEKQQPRRTLVDRRIFAYESANFRLNTEANETIPVLRAAGKPRRAAFFLGGMESWEPQRQRLSQTL